MLKLRSLFKNLVLVQIAKSLTWLKKLDFKQLLKNKRILLSAGITAFIIFLLILFGMIITEEKEEYTETEFGLKNVPEVKVIAIEKIRNKGKILPKIAIILDDAGGELLEYSAIFSIKQPITISILPYLSSSRRIARLASYSGLEVMLHLPMEPENGKYVRNNGSMILGSMSDTKIKSFVIDSLNNVKWAVGINNHMGSRATQDTRVMNDIMDAIKGRGIYFVDSKTSSRSVALNVARNKKILTSGNNVFLDGGPDRNSIKEKFVELVNHAKRNGEAIGIGHATRKDTISVLKELIPEYENSQVQFVYISELVK